MVDDVAVIGVLREKNWSRVELARALAAEREKSEQLRVALERLLNALDTVHADARYIAVWTISHLHIGPYAGPTYVAEFDAARAILAPSSPEGSQR